MRSIYPPAFGTDQAESRVIRREHAERRVDLAELRDSLY